jgi:putative transposase
LNDFLDKNSNAPYWLKQSDIASIVAEAIHFRDERQYELHAYCLMSNHVHILFTLKKDAPVLYKIMQDLKKFTGLHCNRQLNRSGAFWEEEYYDHIVRDQREFERTVRYILQNPVKAGMVSDWQDWTWTYVHRDAVPI